MRIKELLQQAHAQLKDSSSSQLDSELLLAQVLQVNRAYLHTWPEHDTTEVQQQEFLQLLARRLAGEPIAYILGKQEFWSLPLTVNEHTLIPRPETELLVEKTLALLPASSACQVLDLGTGSGAIALALASSRPQWQLTAVDKSQPALMVAKKNAADLHIQNVQFLISEWFSSLPAGTKFHAIVSNPPYVAQDRPELTQGDVAFEPRTALVAGQDGLDDLTAIIAQAPAYLLPGGWLLLEHGYDQAQAVADLLAAAHFSSIACWQDYAGLARVSVAQFLA